MGLCSWAATVAVMNNRDKWRQIISGPIPHLINDVFTAHVFASWSLICVLQDLDRCVTVFKAQENDSDQPWVYIGKQRAHYKKIHG